MPIKTISSLKVENDHVNLISYRPDYLPFPEFRVIENRRIKYKSMSLTSSKRYFRNLVYGLLSENYIDF